MQKNLVSVFSGKSNCERLAIIAASIEKLLRDYSTENCTKTSLENFYEGLFQAKEKGVFQAPSMDCSSCYDFDHYFRLLNDVVNTDMTRKQVTMGLQTWDKVKADDDIIGHLQGALDNFDLNTSQLRLEDSFYLDFNIYDILEKNDSIYLTSELEAVYSPIHLEEVYRMNDKSFMDQRIASITAVTGNNIILEMGSDFQVYVESPEHSYARVEANLLLSKSLEQKRLITAKDRDIFFEDIYLKYRQDLYFMDNVFEKVSWEDISKMLRFGGCFFTKDDFKLTKGKGMAKEQLTRIYYLYDMFDNLSYFRDKNKNNGRTFRSAVYDIEHLRYAANCRFFVTRDKNLESRVKQMYRFMDIDTKVVHVKDIDEFKTFVENHN